jgi:tetratricopeptide (TPR) repeat protein
LYGPRSPYLAAPLESLGRNSLFQKDYASAEKFFFRAVGLNAQVFGESSNQVATSLIQASTVYFADKDYAKAEPYLVRAVRIDESLYGAITSECSCHGARFVDCMIAGIRPTKW